MGIELPITWICFWTKPATTKHILSGERKSERVKDPVKRELLLPEARPYPIGCENPSLEENFYEVCDRDNIEIIDVKATPILEVTLLVSRRPRKRLTSMSSFLPQVCQPFARERVQESLSWYRIRVGLSPW